MKKNMKIIVSLVTIMSAIALIILITNGIASVKKETEQHCFEYLGEATTRLASDLKRTTSIDHSILATMASVIAVENNATDKEICEIMNSHVSGVSNVNYVEMLRPDNTMLDADGTVRDVSGKLDFKKEALRGDYISDICLSTKDTGVRVIRNVVPVKRNNKTIAMLYGVIVLSDFAGTYTTNIYNGDAYVYLMDGYTGNILLDTWHNSAGNISDFYSRKNVSKDSFRDAAEKMKKGQTGDLAFVSQSTGDTLYLHYEPVGVNNWSVMVTVQDRYAMKNSNEINGILFRVAKECGIIIFLYMAFVTASLLYANRRIQKLGMTDHVTGLQNRNAYDTYLASIKDKTFARITCIFVDVNGLHELNNRKGHDAGDHMLRRVAEEIQNAIPTKQIFRTGGDEFIALTEKMTEEECLEKAKVMNEILAKENYSVAYGVASEENTTDISEITRVADERMLQNKREYYSKHDRRMR